MKIIELNKRNNLLDAILAHKELARMETKHKLEEIVKRLKIMEEKTWNYTL
jgi:hypothetical protein